MGREGRILSFLILSACALKFCLFSCEFLTSLNIDLDGYYIVRTEKGQLRLKCGTNTYFIYSVQPSSTQNLNMPLTSRVT